MDENADFAKPLPRVQNRILDFWRFRHGRVLSEKRGYCFFPDAKATAEAVAVSFLYLALA